MRSSIRVIVLAAAVAAASVAAAAGERATLILATTTSTQDSGLLDALLPQFEAEHGITVKVIAVGTGEALAMGRRGDADVLLVHARKAEDEFMAAGFGLLRRDVMHNDFVLAGPGADPAGAAGADVLAALRRVAAAGAPFASRGDRSGTHMKEMELWQQAGIDPAGAPWYLSTGQGMGETAVIASEKRAYLLVDRATFLALGASLDLGVIVEGASGLTNPYGVIVVNPEKAPHVHVREANAFADWLVSPETQRRIGEFGRAKLGRSLFVPDAR